jgi:ATP-dependent RNA circularization protein (DNA/RNA ligase family)
VFGVAEDEQQRLGISPEVRRCIESASDCYTTCTETLTYSLENGSRFSEPRHLRLLIDCAEISQTTQNTLLRGSELGQLLTTVCTEACEKVAESCRELDETDEQLAECAEVCMRCADSCRELAI